MASRTEIADTRASNVLTDKLLKHQSLTLTLAADNYVITANHPPVLFIDPGAAARDVLLPAVADAPYAMFFIFNCSDVATGDETITPKTSADGAIGGTAVVISKDEVGILANDGTTWRGGVLKPT